MKLFLKKCLISILIILILIPSLFSGFVMADEVPLTQERAGNFVANFAINFYDNWSSISVEEAGGTADVGKKDAQGSGSFIWPVPASSRISSPYGWRTNPTTGTKQFHDAIDIAAPQGSDILASDSGEVVEVRDGCTHNKPIKICLCNGGFGNTVVIDHKNGMYTRYSHCTSVDVKLGDVVNKGDKIATVGTTGSSTGYHLDFIIMTKASVSNNRVSIANRETDTVNPEKYVTYGGNSGSSVNTGSSRTVRGSIETQYDENATVDDIVEGTTPYVFSNKSWITFVYKYSLNMDSDILVGNTLNTQYFNTAKETFKDKLIVNDDVIDISDLITNGKLIPGDVLYIKDGKGGGEYALYVGGSRILYATNYFASKQSDDNDKNESTGALRYEYLQYYLDRKKAILLDEHKDEEDYVVPKYGVTQIYRLKDEIANSKTIDDTSLIFNGKGYYTISDYMGIPTQIEYSAERTGLWLFKALAQLIKFFMNLIIYVVRMQIVGWANLVENLMQSVLLGISGHNDNSGILDALFGTNATSASGGRITVESIFFNQIPILDANFFNFKTAGGHSLMIDAAGPVMPGEERPQAPDEQNIVYQLRKNLAFWYSTVRNVSIAILLLVLIYLGIRIAITSSATKKADFKKMFTSWVTALCVVLFLHFFMYFIFVLNDMCVDVCKDWSNAAAQTELSTLIEKNGSQEEMNLYDAIRTKAYAFDYTVGVPATIMYIFLIVLLVRFSFIYIKRYLTIYILAITGSFMGVKYALERINGKKTDILGKWLKDFAFNVLLQTVHAFLYVLFMAIALSVSQTNLAGAFIAFVILNFMLQADKIIVKIFGLDKAGSLAEVNQPEKYSELLHNFMPLYTIYGTVFSFAKSKIQDDSSTIKQLRFAFSKEESMQDFNKALEKKKYERIAKRNIRISKLPIGKLSKYGKLMGKDLSNDMNKRIAAAIKEARRLKRAKFTRSVGQFKDVTLGTLGMGAAVGMTIIDPLAGFTAFSSAKRRISKYKQPRLERKISSYTTSGSTALAKMRRVNSKFDNALNEHVNNEMMYLEERERLLDEYNNLTNVDEKKNKAEEIKAFDKKRKLDKAAELNNLQELNVEKYKAKLEYQSSRARTKVFDGIGLAIGAKTISDIGAANKKFNYETDDIKSKQIKKLGDLEEVAKLEKEIKKKIKKLQDIEKEHIEQLKQEKQGQKEIEKIDNKFDETIKEVRKENISSSNIKKAVNEYLYENSISKITGEDVNDILDKLKEMLEESGKSFDLTDDIKEKVKDQLEAKMIKDSKGLGFDAKDATIEIRDALVKKEYISLSDIKKACDEYASEKSITKITGEDVNAILDKLNNMLEKSDNSFEITDDIKKEVKKQLENKIKIDTQGLGFDVKDVAIEIGNTIENVEKDNVLITFEDNDIEALNSYDEKEKRIYIDIVEKIEKINKYNEISKIKHKEALVDMNKLYKELKKVKDKGKEGVK